MDRNQTVGDDSELECPACGKINTMTDWSIDGCLVEGNTIACAYCEAPIELVLIEYSMTITAQVKDPYQDWCDAWGRIGRQVKYRAEEKAKCSGSA